MNDTKSKLVILIGSVRDGRFGPTVASWVADRAREHGGFEVEVVDPAEIDVPLALPAESPLYAGDRYPRPASMRAVREVLAAADNVPCMLNAAKHQPNQASRGTDAIAMSHASSFQRSRREGKTATR